MAFSLDLITGILSFVLTLMVLSYLIGDNPLFKISIYLFVGVASGYVAAITFWQVLYPKLFLPTLGLLQSRDMNQGLLLIVPWLGVLFILMKASPRLSGAARLVMAFLAGAGAAVTIAGALIGSLIPQVMATINFFDAQNAAARNISTGEVLGNGAILLFGVVTSLAYFHFGALQKADGSKRRLGIVEIIALIGQIFIGITLGAIFAGVYAAALTAFIERITSLLAFINSLTGLF